MGDAVIEKYNFKVISISDGYGDSTQVIAVSIDTDVPTSIIVNYDMPRRHVMDKVGDIWTVNIEAERKGTI